MVNFKPQASHNHKRPESDSGDQKRRPQIQLFAHVVMFGLFRPKPKAEGGLSWKIDHLPIRAVTLA